MALPAPSSASALAAMANSTRFDGSSASSDGVRISQVSISNTQSSGASAASRSVVAKTACQRGARFRRAGVDAQGQRYPLVVRIGRSLHVDQR